jgi:hypothetical protein
MVISFPSNLLDVDFPGELCILGIKREQSAAGRARKNASLRVGGAAIEPET